MDPVQRPTDSSRTDRYELECVRGAVKFVTSARSAPDFLRELRDPRGKRRRVLAVSRMAITRPPPRKGGRLVGVLSFADNVGHIEIVGGRISRAPRTLSGANRAATNQPDR